MSRELGKPPAKLLYLHGHNTFDNGAHMPFLEYDWLISSKFDFQEQSDGWSAFEAKFDFSFNIQRKEDV